MPTVQQIENFRRKSRAQGFTEAQIEMEIARKIQTEAATMSAVPKTQQAIPPTTSTVMEKPKKTLRGLAKNAVQDVVDFTINTPIDTAKSVGALGFETGRAAILGSQKKKATKKADELLALSKQLKAEKDPIKKKQLIERSRALSGEVEKTSQALDASTSVVDPFMDINEIPENPVVLGKGILKNTGRTFGLTTDEEGNVVFDAQIALDSAYERPVSTALLAYDLSKGVGKVIKKSGKTAAKTSGEVAKDGILKRTGAKLRQDVLNPQVDASPFYADDVAVMQKAQEAIGLKGSAKTQLQQLPAAFKKSQTVIKKLLREADSPQSGVLDEQMLKEIADSNYSLEDPIFSKAVDSELAVLKSLDGQPATAYYEQLGKYRELLKSTRKKIDNGTTLLPKEEARLAAFNSLKETIDSVSPEVRAINTLQNQMYNISEGLVKRSNGKGANLPGVTQVTGIRLPAETTQGIADGTGRLLEGTSSFIDKTKGKLSKLPLDKLGSTTGLGEASLLQNSTENITDGQQYNESNSNFQKGLENLQDQNGGIIQNGSDPNQGKDGNGYQGDNEQDFQQDETILPDATQSEVANLFEGLSKQQVLALAFQSGAKKSDLEEISSLYDMFATQKEGVVGEDAQKAASALRTEYLAQTKQNGFMDVVNSYRKVVNASATPAGDLSLIFAYMKMLDPGSTVREGEYASAEKTAGVPDQIRNQYNKILEGRKLSDKQRAEFKTEAKQLYQNSSEVQQQIDDIYTDLAGRYGVDPALLSIGSFRIQD